MLSHLDNLFKMNAWMDHIFINLKYDPFSTYPIRYNISINNIIKGKG